MSDLNNLSKEELIKLLLESKSKCEELEQNQKELNDELTSINNKNEALTEKAKKMEAKYESLEKENKSLDTKFQKLKVEFRFLQEKNNKLLLDYEKVSLELENLKRTIFYKKTEKLHKEDSPEDKAINEAEGIVDRQKRGRKSGGVNFNNDIPTTGLREIVKDFSDEELERLNSEHRLIRIGEDIVVKLIKKEAVYEWVKIVRPKYRDTVTNEIVQLENTEAFKKCAVDSSIIADVINNKMNLGVPIERQAEFFKSEGINISSSLLANYIIKAADSLKPIYKALIDALLNNSSRVIHCDETPLKVLDNQKERKSSYMYVMTTTFWDNPIYIYDFNMTRETTRINEYLKDYHGYLTVDGYPGYDKFKPGYVAKDGDYTYKLEGCSLCWTHARRYFFECDPEMNSKRAANKKPTAAKKVVNLISKLFDEERAFRKNKYTPDQIRKGRNTVKYNKILNDIWNYVSSLTPIPNTKLDKACTYIKNNWNELITIQKYGYLDICNSIAERAVKPFAVARKSFLFCKSNEGATATGILFSIVQTARANMLSVEKYLNYVFNNLDSKTVSDLLPWSEKLPRELKIKLK